MLQGFCLMAVTVAAGTIIFVATPVGKLMSRRV
jgi:hypothetical protein